MSATATQATIEAPVEPIPLRGFALLHKAIAYVLAYLGLSGLALGGELEPISLLVLAIAYAATWWAEGARLEDARWQRGWTGVLLALLVVQVARGALGEPPLAMALVWSGALQVARLANRRSAREYLQIAVLAFLHLCAATVLSTEIGYGLAFLGFVIVAPWMLALTHLRAEIEAQHLARATEVRDAGEPDDERHTLPPGVTSGAASAQLARVLSSRRLVGAPFLVGTALLSLPLFALTAILFVAFPRVGLGMLAFGGDGGAPVAGFGNEVELGQVGRIRDDPTVVMRVTPPGVTSSPPDYLDIYLRGTSFDHYDGRRWSRTSREGGRPVQMFDSSEYAITRSYNVQLDVPFTIVLDALDQDVVFLPEHTVGLQIPPRVVSGRPTARRIVLHPGLDIRYEDGDALGLRYTAWVSASPRSEIVRPIGEGEAARNLQLPDGHERVVALAREWTAGATTDRERAERIALRLRTSPFSYSLDLRDPGDRPPLERFLFEWRSGHCEYYASAMVVLLRAVGVPARNVTGFLGGRWNAYGGYYAVRSGDAHAWVEAYLPGEGWVTFDPTPPGRNDVGFAASLLGELRNILDAAIVWWELDVVSFDLGSQRNILNDAVRSFRRGRARGADVAEEPTSRAERGRWPWAFALLALGAAALGVHRLWRARRGRQSSLPERVARIVALYRLLEAALAAQGVPRPASATPREHARALRERGFHDSATVERVTDRYNQARFGETELGDAEIAALEAEVAALASRSPK